MKIIYSSVIAMGLISLAFLLPPTEIQANPSVEILDDVVLVTNEDGSTETIPSEFYLTTTEIQWCDNDATSYPAGPYVCPAGQAINMECVEAAGAIFEAAMKSTLDDLCKAQLGALASHVRCMAQPDTTEDECDGYLADEHDGFEATYAVASEEATDDFWEAVADCCEGGGIKDIGGTVYVIPDNFLGDFKHNAFIDPIIIVDQKNVIRSSISAGDCYLIPVATPTRIELDCGSAGFTDCNVTWMVEGNPNTFVLLASCFNQLLNVDIWLEDNGKWRLRAWI